MLSADLQRPARHIRAVDAIQQAVSTSFAGCPNQDITLDWSVVGDGGCSLDHASYPPSIHTVPADEPFGLVSADLSGDVMRSRRVGGPPGQGCQASDHRWPTGPKRDAGCYQSSSARARDHRPVQRLYSLLELVHMTRSAWAPHSDPAV